MGITQNGIFEETLRQQTALVQFGEFALSSNNLDAIMAEACRLAGDALGTQHAKVLELQEDGQSLLVRAAVGWKPGVVGETMIAAEQDTTEGHALRTGQPMLSPDVATETRFKYQQFSIDNGVKAVATVLIFGRQNERPFGLLQIDSQVPRQFSESETLLLRSYANLVAAAVSRLRADRALEESVVLRTRELTVENAKRQSEALERESVEEMLRQSTKMEAVGQVAVGLAHDFNNLLASISGSLQLTRNRLSKGQVADTARFIESAMASVERAAALTHRLLAIFRPRTLDPKPTNVNGLIDGQRDLFTRSVGRAVSFETQLSNDLWPTLCDQKELQNALFNLIINAKDAMPEGGSLRIETENSVFPKVREETDTVQVEKIRAGDYVALHVIDTGSGMSPDAVARAFDPFFTTKPTGDGAGLGLSMIYGFVKQSKGYIVLSSAPNKGTAVILYLPRHRGPAEEVKVIEAKTILAHAEIDDVVLLVEDEAGVRLVVAEVLADVGYKVLQSVNGQAALGIVQSGVRIDILITDIGLPGGINGRLLAHAARDIRPDLKVLFITGYSEKAATGKGRLEPGMEVMTKPFDLDALAEKVQRMING